MKSDNLPVSNNQKVIIIESQKIDALTKELKTIKKIVDDIQRDNKQKDAEIQALKEAQIFVPTDKEYAQNISEIGKRYFSVGIRKTQFFRLLRGLGIVMKSENLIFNRIIEQNPKLIRRNNVHDLSGQIVIGKEFYHIELLKSLVIKKLHSKNLFDEFHKCKDKAAIKEFNDKHFGKAVNVAKEKEKMLKTKTTVYKKVVKKEQVA